MTVIDVSNEPLVSIVTATTGNLLLVNNIKSVLKQTHHRIQHLVVCDGSERRDTVDNLIEGAGLWNSNLDMMYLPYSVGKDRFNGHRIYAASTFLAEGEYIMFLDDDNYLEPDHVESCLKMIKSGSQWTYSLRNIVDKFQNHLCQDNCESLGEWPSVINPSDYFVDMNSFFLPRKLATIISPIMNRKFREPGQMEVDRAMTHMLRQIQPQYKGTHKYTVNYTVGNTSLSVTPDFFVKGNEEMLRRYNGALPWKS